MDYSEWIETQKARLRENCLEMGVYGCLLSQMGGQTRLYSVYSVRFPWDRKKRTLYGHRFAYMLHTEKFDLSEEFDVSHLCHQKRCINPEHLSFEPPHINQDRQVCRGTHPTRCRKHKPYQDCLI